MEGCPCLEAEGVGQRASGDLQFPPFLILSPRGPGQRIPGLRKLSLSALSPVLPREGEDSFQHPSQQGAHWRLLSLGRLCLTVYGLAWSPHSYSCSPPPFWQEMGFRAGVSPGLPPQQSKALPLLQPGEEAPPEGKYRGRFRTWVEFEAPKVSFFQPEN